MMKTNYLIIGVVILLAAGAAVLGLKGKSGPSNAPKQRGEETVEQRQSPVEETAGGKRLTAKAAYELALNEAKKYASDGYLVDMYSVASSYKKTYADGTSESWFFIFHSATKPQYRVRMDGDKASTVSDIRGTKTVEIPSGWLDSDQAAQIGASKCTGAPENSYFYSINTKVDNKSFSWAASCELGGKRQNIYLDAFSGTVE